MDKAGESEGDEDKKWERKMDEDDGADDDGAEDNDDPDDDVNDDDKNGDHEKQTRLALKTRESGWLIETKSDVEAPR